MRITSLEFGSLLSYTPRGASDEMEQARDVMLAIKRDGFIDEQPPIPMSQWIARTVQQNRLKLPFASFFQPSTVLVPVPRSSLMRPGTLWGPERIATALAKNGIGRDVVACLVRATALRKAALSDPSERPTPGSSLKRLVYRGESLNPHQMRFCWWMTLSREVRLFWAPQIDWQKLSPQHESAPSQR